MIINTNQDFDRILEALFNAVKNNTSDNFRENVTNDKNDHKSSKLQDKNKHQRKFFRKCIQAVKADGLLLQHIDEALRIPELCELAVKKNPLALEFVPRNLRTKEICIQALRKNPDAMQFVPDTLKATCQTELNLKKQKTSLSKRIEKGIRNSIYYFFYPERKRLNTLLQNRSVSSDELLASFQKLPTAKKTPELCEKVLNHNIEAFEHLPEHVKTPQLCYKAVRQNGRMLKYVPVSQINYRLCKKAVEDHWSNLAFVPLKFRNSELLNIGVKNNGCAIRFFPPSLLTPDICLLAILKNREAVKHLPIVLKSQTLKNAREFIQEKRELTPEKFAAFWEKWEAIAPYMLKTDFISKMVNAPQNENLPKETVHNIKQIPRQIQENIRFSLKQRPDGPNSSNNGLHVIK